MPRGQAWTEPQPYLVSAAVALSAGRHESSAAALDAAEGILGASSRRSGGRGPAGRRDDPPRRLPPHRGPHGGGGGRCPCRGAGRQGPGRQARPAPGNPGPRAVRPRSCRAVVGPSRRGSPRPRFGGGRRDRSGRRGRTSRLPRPSRAGGGVARPAGPRGYSWPPRRPRPCAADEQRPPGPHPNPAALVALAWVHLEHNELREARSRLKQADAALGVSPDKLIGAVACLVAAYGGLAEGRAAVAAQIVARARSGWSVPAWLEQRLSLAESRAYVAAGDIQAALAAAERAGRDDPPEAAVMLAHAWAAAGDAPPSKARAGTRAGSRQRGARTGAPASVAG